MGKLLVLEGLDGSGKATQAAALAKWLGEEGATFRKITFPNYDSPSSALVKMYLAGDFGTQPGDVNAWAASAFYAVDRYASFKMDWQDFYNSGGLVLADRYATSNAIHQLAKLPQEEWQVYINWMEDFEYAKLGIPKPDMVLYLDVDPAVSQALLAKRYGSKEGRDIHERDEEYLRRCREAALWCTANLGWLRIECTRDGAMLGVDAITGMLQQYTKELV